MTTPAIQQAAQSSSSSCSNCGHQRDQHDRVALRYCEASAGHERRGCICHGLITTEADARLQFSDQQA